MTESGLPVAPVGAIPRRSRSRGAVLGATAMWVVLYSLTYAAEPWTQLVAYPTLAALLLAQLFAPWSPPAVRRKRFLTHARLLQLRPPRAPWWWLLTVVAVLATAWPWLWAASTLSCASASPLPRAVNVMPSVAGLPTMAALAVWGFRRVGAVLFEEFMFRGLLLNAVRRRMGPTAAVVISTLVFAVGHMAPNLVLQNLPSGAILAVSVMVSRSVWTGVMMHAALNLSIGVLANGPLYPAFAGTFAVGVFGCAISVGVSLATALLYMVLWRWLVMWRKGQAPRSRRAAKWHRPPRLIPR